MDLSDPWILFSALFIGLVGLALFIYGKKAPDGAVLFAGIALSVLPMLAHTLLAMWGLAGLCCAGVVAYKRLA